MCYTDNINNSVVIFGYNGRDGVVTDTNGLIYMRARYYCPEMRRFVNADIIAGEISNAITLNRYAYANGNPVSLVDPFGLSAERYPLKSYEERESDFWKYINQDSFLFLRLSFLEYCEYLTAYGEAEIIDFFIGATQDKNGYYHISQDYWQSEKLVGYNNLYDYVFNKGAGLVGDEPFYDFIEFSCKDKTYVFWYWKGDYINLGAGAECGIYEVPNDLFGRYLNSEDLNHVYTSTDNNLNMSITLEDTKNKQTMFHYTPQEEQWWCNAFDPFTQGMQTEDMRVTVKIDFSNNTSGLYDAFYNQHSSNIFDDWSFDKNARTATLTY